MFGAPPLLAITYLFMQVTKIQNLENYKNKIFHLWDAELQILSLEYIWKCYQQLALRFICAYLRRLPNFICSILQLIKRLKTDLRKKYPFLGKIRWSIGGLELLTRGQESFDLFDLHDVP